MVIKKLVLRIRQALLCCSQHRSKALLDIGEPTNVRHIDVSDAIPGLTDAERKHIREKASSDAIHLLGLQSHPTTSTPSPAGSDPQLGSHSPSLAPTCREPPEPLLNAASKDLPTALPTPPRRTHNESSPPATRMKSMSAWQSPYSNSDSLPRRLSFGTSSSSGSSSTNNSALFEKLERVKESNNGPQKISLNESFMTLNFDWDWKDQSARDEVLTPRTLSLSEGFEMTDTIGGHGGLEGNKAVANVVAATRVADIGDSDSGVDEYVVGDKSPLVKI